MVKLRIYYRDGYNKGNLDHEEHFETLEKAKARYRQLFKYDDYGFNPTIWITDEDDNREWCRIERIENYSKITKD